MVARAAPPHRAVAALALALALAGAAAAPACEDRGAPADRPALAAGIAATLTARLGAPVRARCLGLLDACVAHLPDGTALPVATARAPAGGWEWRLDGVVVDTARLAAYLDAEVAALGQPQRVTCGPRFRRARAGERVSCALAGGGLAFATLGPDGRAAIELALEPAAASARGGADAARGAASEAASEAALDAAARALRDAPGEDVEAAGEPASEGASERDAEAGAAASERAGERAGARAGAARPGGAGPLARPVLR